jgi:hypothetical protein
METHLCPKCNFVKPLSDFYLKSSENRYNSWCKQCVYKFQKIRWKDRKRKAVELFGGKCCICGYNKNLAALEFHHKDPSIKEFSWNKLRLRNWESVIGELKKCILVCSNCHKEIHSPGQSIIVSENNDNNSLNHNYLKLEDLKPTGKCPSCYKDTYGTKYCSVGCANFASRRVKRPSKEQLEDMLKTMSMVKIGKQYGVSDKSIKKWITIYGI